MKIAFIDKESLIYIGLVFLLYYIQFTSWNGEYLDTDCFFHALRMVEWFEKPSFWEQKMWWSNYPIGEISHWTRPIYIIWGILSLPFLIFYPIKEAVFYAGLLICPLFCILSIIFIIKSLKNILNYKFRLLFFVLLTTQANFMKALIFYRPDHHAIFVFLTVWVLYLTNLFINKKDDKLLKFIAFVLSFSLWLSVEGIFLFISFIGFMYIGYLFFGYRFDYIRKTCLWYTLGVVFCLIINPCYQGWFYLDTGRLSFFYVIVLASLCGILEVAKYVDDKLKKTVILFVLFCALFGVLYALGLLKSPIDDRIKAIFIDRITEMKKINIYFGAYPFVALLFGGFYLKRHYKNELFIYLYISLVIFSLLMLFGMRFLQYAGFYSALIITLFIQDRFINYKKCWGVIVFVVLLEYISFIVNLVMFGSVFDKPLPSIYFSQLDNLPKGSVITDTFFTPHIVWYGNRGVIASPYHGNIEGLIDNHNILFSSDEKEVIKLIKKHEAGSVYLIDTMDGFYDNPSLNCDKLYGKILGCKNYPSWLVPVKNSDGSLFRIDYDKL